MVETALRAVIDKPGEPPALSLAERDRRHGLVRRALRERDVDALVVTGTDLLYLSGGLSGEEFGFNFGAERAQNPLLAEICHNLQIAEGGRGLAGGGNFTLTTGMIYSISPTLVDAETGEALVGGTSLPVTEQGYRELGERDVEMLVAG